MRQKLYKISTSMQFSGVPLLRFGRPKRALNGWQERALLALLNVVELLKLGRVHGCLCVVARIGVNVAATEIKKIDNRSFLETCLG